MIPPRTTQPLVQGILLQNYDSVNNPELAPFIATASPIVDRVVAMAATKGWTLTSVEQQNIETYLSAHFYCLSDKTYQSKSTGGASGNFIGSSGLRLDFTEYGQMAMAVDVSGCLQNLNARQIVRGLHLGRSPFPQSGEPNPYS
jgi:hypothetical protein